MMTELSLHVLDVTENSIVAGATFIEITIRAITSKDLLTIIITDNGYGMNKDTLLHVTDPFFTTRTTRKVGLGLPFFKQASTASGGHFSITSAPDKGTSITASFMLSHIDRMPLGDITCTMYTLITSNTQIEFLYTYQIDDRMFILDTREFHKILGDISFQTPLVSGYIKDYLTENKQIVDNGYIL